MWLASIFGPYLVIHGLWMIFYHENMSKIWTSIKNTPSIFHLTAAIFLWVGLAAVNTFNVWTMSSTVFVTLLGWILILRGVAALFLPQLYIKIAMNPSMMKLWGIVGLLWGLIVSWLAFGR